MNTCRIINFVLAGALAIVGYLYYDCATGEVHYEGNPSQIIPISKAIEMRNEYNNVIAPLIENGKNSPTDTKYQATEFAFLELDTLKKYIHFLDEVKHLNPEKAISGVRIYFAAYNSSNSATYPGRETFFIAPTMKIASTEASATYPIIDHVPFYIKPSGENPLVGTFTEINGLNRSSSVPKNNAADVGTSLILNELQICPPPAK